MRCSRTQSGANSSPLSFVGRRVMWLAWCNWLIVIMLLSGRIARMRFLLPMPTYKPPATSFMAIDGRTVPRVKLRES